MKNKPVEKIQDTDLRDLLQEIRGGSSNERRAALRSFDWSTGDLRKLGWSMSQKGLDLGTAMIVFFNGNPARYNYLRKDEVPLDARDRCQVLDAIHRRVTSGFYLPDPDQGLGDVFALILDWVERQEMDRARGRHGRWVFDPTLFTPITLKAVLAEQDDEADTSDEDDVLDRSIFFDAQPAPKRVSLWRDLLSPILG